LGLLVLRVVLRFVGLLVRVVGLLVILLVGAISYLGLFRLLVLLGLVELLVLYGLLGLLVPRVVGVISSKDCRGYSICTKRRAIRLLGCWASLAINLVGFFCSVHDCFQNYCIIFIIIIIIITI
jgi:hypothetical protein